MVSREKKSRSFLFAVEKKGGKKEEKKREEKRKKGKGPGRWEDVGALTGPQQQWPLRPKYGRHVDLFAVGWFVSVAISLGVLFFR